MVKKWWSFIKDPLFGYIHINELERKIIDTHPVQRTRRLRQLSGAEYVYPGANHTRFEHSLGVMYLASRLAENISETLTKEEIQELRLAGLLHDVGHGPFSHVFESLLTDYLNKTHEDLTQWLVKNTEIKDVLREYGYDHLKISKLAVGKLNDANKPYLDQFLRSTVDADKMDYLVRDSYHTGAGYSVDVFRLIYTLDVCDGVLAVNKTALYTLEAFLIARIESFKTIYFHKTSRAAQLMLVSALEAAKDECGFISFKTPEEYLYFDDYTTWTLLKNCTKSKQIIRDLEKRKLLKCVYEKVFYTQEEFVSNIFTSKSVRDKIRCEIAEEADVDVENVLIDVPLVPSVPYMYSSNLEPMEIPIFAETPKGRVFQKLEEVSKIIGVMKGFLNILRIYTCEELRDKVGKAAAKILGEPPYSAKIST
ncbi:MAG: HD domain-containing protein [Candidatus Odinarchaeia archaeon]